MIGRKATILVVSVFAGLFTCLAIFLAVHHLRNRPISIRGAVIKEDADPMKESPITGVDISAADGLATREVKSNFEGFFDLTLRKTVNPTQTITLRFRHPDYKPLDITETVNNKLLVVHLVSILPKIHIRSDRPLIPITNVLIRYMTIVTEQQNVGTEAKTFQIRNVANVPCNHTSPCSPDKKWKAAIATESLDAGEGNVFQNARVSCIAGPCPFTRIDLDGFSLGGRHIRVSVRNWSDTTTFLLQAEVYRSEINNIVRTAYPVILGRSLHFSLPPIAEGPSIEAEENGQFIIFPLGPKAILSWADCNVITDKKSRSTIYRCDLKSGYEFR